MENKRYAKIILPQAEDDIQNTLEYISIELGNPDAADKLLSDIIKAVDTVSQFPLSRPLLKGRLAVDTEYRRIDVNNFMLVYKVVESEKEVRVMAALYAPSDIMARLKDRL